MTGSWKFRAVRKLIAIEALALICACLPYEAGTNACVFLVFAAWTVFGSSALSAAGEA